MGIHNGQSFSTKDSDNDAADVKHCADEYKGGWWYEYCHRANLNGIYREGNYTGRFNGIDWNRWKGYNYSLKKVEMKTRRIHFDQINGATD